MRDSFAGTPHHGMIVSFLEWYPRTDMRMIIKGNLFQNIQRSFYRTLLLDVYYGTITMENNEWRNVTSAVDVSLLKTTKTVTIDNLLL